MRPVFATVAIASVLVGCAQTVWVRPGATQSDFACDRATCDYQSEMGTPSSSRYDGRGNMNDAIADGIVSGIADGIRKGTLMNKCMVANGWTLQKVEPVTDQTIASQNYKKVELAGLRDRRIACTGEIRNKPTYTALRPHFSEIKSGAFTMVQLTDESLPTVNQSPLLANYWDEGKICVTAMIEGLAVVAPSWVPNFQQLVAENEQVMILMAKRQITWGEGARRQKAIAEATNAKLNLTKI